MLVGEPGRAIVHERRKLLGQGDLGGGHGLERLGHKIRVPDQVSVQRRAAQHLQGVHRPLQVGQHEPDHIGQRRVERQHIAIEPVSLDHPRQPAGGQVHRPAGEGRG